MGRTPDRFPGVRQEEEVKFLENEATGPFSSGSIRFESGSFVFVDISGSYDPRNKNQVQVSVNDILPGSLQSKVAAGTGIALTVLNPGGNEQLEINSTISGITSGSHRDLDQLVHSIAESSNTEVITDSFGKTTRVTVWTDATRTVRIREMEWAYVLGRTATKVSRQYDAAGVLIETLTETYIYAQSGRLNEIQAVLT